MMWRDLLDLASSGIGAINELIGRIIGQVIITHLTTPSRRRHPTYALGNNHTHLCYYSLASFSMKHKHSARSDCF